MTSITIRRLDAQVKAKLRVRAAQHGRSMEEEVRAILRSAVQQEPSPELDLGAAIARRMAPFGGVELDLPPRDRSGDPPRFD